MGRGGTDGERGRHAGAVRGSEHRKRFRFQKASDSIPPPQSRPNSLSGSHTAHTYCSPVCRYTAAVCRYLLLLELLHHAVQLGLALLEVALCSGQHVQLCVRLGGDLAHPATDLVLDGGQQRGLDVLLADGGAAVTGRLRLHREVRRSEGGRLEVRGQRSEVSVEGDGSSDRCAG